MSLLSAREVSVDGKYSYAKTPYEKNYFPKNTLSLIRVIRGTMCLISDEETLFLNGGDLLLIPVSDIVSFCSHSENLSYCWFNFVAKSVPFFTQGKVYKTEFTREEEKRIKNLLSFDDDPDPYSIGLANAVFKEHFYHFILALRKDEQETTEGFSGILKNIKEHISENISVKELAGEYHMSERNFRAMFAKYAGTTPKQYQIKIKMQKAAQILQDSNFSINKVAETLGYASPFQFSRDFKKYYGVSPNSYRKDKDDK